MAESDVVRPHSGRRRSGWVACAFFGNAEADELAGAMLTHKIPLMGSESRPRASQSPRQGTNGEETND